MVALIRLSYPISNIVRIKRKEIPMDLAHRTAGDDPARAPVLLVHGGAEDAAMLTRRRRRSPRRGGG